MAKVRLKGVDGVIRSLNEVFKTAKKSKDMQNKIGKFVVDRNKFNARTGKSLESNKSPESLPGLKSTSKKIRARFAKDHPGDVDTRFFRATKSNVTLTGQLINSIKYLIKDNQIFILVSGRRKRIKADDLGSNEAVYADLVKRGFGFLGLDETGQKRVKKIVLDEFRRTIKKIFK